MPQRPRQDGFDPMKVPITPRQQQVLVLVARGLDNQEIGRELGLMSSTVSNHVQAVMRKTRIHNRVRLAGLAARRGFLPEEDLDFPQVELTPRELAVAAHIAEGLAMREIARRLMIPETEAKKGAAAVLKKLHTAKAERVAVWISRP